MELFASLEHSVSLVPSSLRKLALVSNKDSSMRICYVFSLIRLTKQDNDSLENLSPSLDLPCHSLHCHHHGDRSGHKYRKMRLAISLQGAVAGKGTDNPRSNSTVVLTTAVFPCVCPSQARVTEQTAGRRSTCLTASIL